mgnify:CR=1 FL=1|jgi:peptidoglycan/LPS O-acetylase OafA/YrhL
MDNFFKNYKITYRQDIDSLRGLAVLAVVLYHLAPGRMPGGFLGVDIFFVISGYLITTIIIKDDINNFSFLDFYFRRIKRLLPALLIVLTACSLAAFFFLPEIYFIQFAKHLSFSSIFVLNFTLLGENGYFDTSSIFKPLLHLWSLCIEEQFYIVWPLLIFFLKKNKINLLYFSFFAFIFSFLLNFFYLNDQIFTFYFPLTRFWELLLGSILSIVLFGYKEKFHFLSNFTLNFILIFGYILIFVSFFSIKELKNFSIIYYFPAVLGTFLVLFSGSFINIKNTIISNKILSWLGLISFPLYLWHWPIISFLRIVQGGEVEKSTRIIAFLISILLSWLTYSFIERKIRFSKKKIVPIALLIYLAFIFILGYVGFKHKFYNEHLFAKIKFEGDIGHETFFKYTKKNYFTCSNKELSKIAGIFNGTKRCFESELNKKIEYLLIGDSTAEHFYPGIAKELKGKNIAGYFASGLPASSNQDYRTMLDEIKKLKDVEIIFISANWNSFSDYSNQETYYNNHLKEYIYSIKKYSKKIYIINGTPAFSFHPSKCKYYNKMIKNNNKCKDLQYSRINDNLKNLENLKDNIYVLNTRNLLCVSSKENSCSMIKDNKVLFRDETHLNLQGSEYFAKKIFELINSK